MRTTTDSRAEKTEAALKKGNSIIDRALNYLRPKKKTPVEKSEPITPEQAIEIIHSAYKQGQIPRKKYVDIVIKAKPVLELRRKNRETKG